MMATIHSGTVKHLSAQLRSSPEYAFQKAAFLNLPYCHVAVGPVCAELALHKHTVTDDIWHAP